MLGWELSQSAGLGCNARRQHRRLEYNRQLDDGFRQADRPTPQRARAPPTISAWDGVTRPLRVGVIGANPNRSSAKDSTSRRCAALRMCSWRRWRRPAVPAPRRRCGFRCPRGLRRSPRPDHGVRHRHRLGVGQGTYRRDLVLAALGAEKHVYCEWPLGRDRGEAVEMAAAAGIRAVHVAIGLQAYMNPAARRAAELIAAGAMGRPSTADLLQHLRFRAAPTGGIRLSQQD